VTHEETRLWVLGAWERWPARRDYDDPVRAVGDFFLSFRALYPGVIAHGNFLSPHPLHAVRYWCLERERERALTRARPPESGRGETQAR
jgi:hypothetical protein